LHEILETNQSLVIKLDFTPQTERYRKKKEKKKKKNIHPCAIWNRKCFFFCYLFTLHVFNSKNGKTNIRTNMTGTWESITHAPNPFLKRLK